MKRFKCTSPAKSCIDICEIELAGKEDNINPPEYCAWTGEEVDFELLQPVDVDSLDRAMQVPLDIDPGRKR